MSLRTKILLLFVVFAVTPMIVIAVADYYQSLFALAAVIETKAEAVSEARARTIVDARGQVELALVRVATAPQVERLLERPAAQPAGEASVLRSVWPEWRVSFERVELLNAAGARVAVLADSTPTAERPRSCPRPAGLELETPVASAEGRELGRIRATPRPAALLLPAAVGGRFGVSGINLVVDRATERVVYAEPCPLTGRAAQDVLQAAPEQNWRAGLDAGTGTFRVRHQGVDYVAAAAPVPRAGWVYLTLVPLPEFTAPFGQARSTWLLLVLCVGLVTAAAFVLLTRRPLLALRRLAAAADAIGRGEFSLWLPPGGNDEVGRLSQAFGRMAGRLKDLMRQAEFGRQLRVVGQMGAYVAHEIRNPLGAISIYLEGLARHADEGRTPPNAAKVLHLAIDEIRRLEDIVTSFLALGQTERGERGEVPLHRVAEQALLVLRGELRRRGLRSDLTTTGDDTVFVDQAGLQGAIVNLLLNAADASPAEGHIRLWTDAARGLNGDAVVRLHVADEGPGVPPELRERIFEPFFTTKARGSGIGLPVARQLVEEHGGRLYCQSTDKTGAGSGAEFVLELPLAPLQTGARREPPEAEDEILDADAAGVIALEARRSAS